jgi:pimeloyl-ACP methyl ester carboxylesterase
MTSARFRVLSLAGPAAVGAAALAVDPPQSALAQGTPQVAHLAAAPAARPTIVLVHGAFADGTGWQSVIPLLERDGYAVVAVQNPLTSFDVDVATTTRLIDAPRGPVVAVGHSYGGAVITGAAAGNPNVKALVYVAAFAPDAGEAIGAFGERYPAPLAQALRPDAAGFLYVDRGRFRDIFASDVPETQARVMAAAQKPVIGSVFRASVPQAAWKTIPSWYLVAQDDRAINPALERFYARRMGATTTEVKSSHAVFVSHPDAVARVIEQAATATSR